MNYVERHFGDWARDTAHLSMLEDGAYNRLCDVYYVREAPLPADMAACYRLARAFSKPERDAVKAVLAEFFVLSPANGYVHRRCDEEIARFRTKSGKASASAKARWIAQATADAPADANSYTDGVRHAGVDARAPTPHSPLPDTQSSQPKVARVRAARDPSPDKPKPSKKAPKAFAVTDAMREWAAQNAPAVDIEAETEKLRDHEFATPRSDWLGTWRNWLRKASEFTPRNGNGTHHAAALPWQDTKDGVINRACALVLREYDGIEPWERYRRHVIEEDAKRRQAA